MGGGPADSAGQAKLVLPLGEPVTVAVISIGAIDARIESRSAV
jgi:hypothetical protein